LPSRLSGDDVLVEYEFGVVRVSGERGLVWQRTHDDITARVSEIGDDVVWLVSEHDRFDYQLSDGLFIAT
jgi:hypothetical protein